MKELSHLQSGKKVQKVKNLIFKKTSKVCKLLLVFLLYLCQFKSDSHIQGQFWKLENKSFHLAPHMGVELQNSFKEGPRGELYGKVTIRHQGFRKYLSPNQTCPVLRGCSQMKL